MTDRLVHIKNLARGETDFVTLGFILGNKATSTQVFSEDALKANLEIMNYKNKGMLELVNEEDYQRAQAHEKAQQSSKTTVEDAIEQDNPSKNELQAAVAQAQSALNRLAELVSKTDEKVKKSEAKQEETTQDLKKAIEDDGLDLPQSAPVGLTPQPTTQQYLKKSPKEKRQFLKECFDITMLRDIALFEPDAKLKLAARKAAKSAETAAQMGANIPQAVG